MTTRSRSEEALRNDIPVDLRMRAAAIDPALLSWLEAAYPTDAEHAREERRRRGQLKQQELSFVHRGAA